MNAALDARDVALIEKFVDEQRAPFRRVAYVLFAGLPIGLAVALLEWNDARRGPYVPNTVWIFALAGAALGVAGWLMWRANRRGASDALSMALLDDRASVTQIDVIRVVNSDWDRVVIQCARAKEPIRVLVHQRDRDAVVALLMRACPQARRERATEAVDLPR
jgi:hypothetical protein